MKQPLTFESASLLLGRKPMVRVARHARLVRETNYIDMFYYETPIIRFHARGVAQLWSYSDQTPLEDHFSASTKRLINKHSGIHVATHNRKWVVIMTDGTVTPFEQGMFVY